MTSAIALQEGTLVPTYCFLPGEYLAVVPSALKVSALNDEIISRWYNLSDKDERLKLYTTDRLYKTDLLEEVHLASTTNEIILHKKEILTLAQR